MTAATLRAAPEAPAPRKPRKIFLWSAWWSPPRWASASSPPSAPTPRHRCPPRRAARCPSFSRPDLNGSGQVGVPADGGGHGTPGRAAVLRQLVRRLPRRAAAAGGRRAPSGTGAGGALAKVQVIGVDSEDTTASAKAFIHSSRRDVPGGLRSRAWPSPAATSTSRAIPTPSSSTADGTISAIVPGRQLTAAKFTAEEKKLIPSGS